MIFVYFLIDSLIKRTRSDLLLRSFSSLTAIQPKSLSFSCVLLGSSPSSATKSLTLPSTRWWLWASWFTQIPSRITCSNWWGASGLCCSSGEVKRAHVSHCRLPERHFFFLSFTPILYLINAPLHRRIAHSASLVFSQPDNFPYKEEIAALSNVCLVLIVLIFISCILGFKVRLPHGCFLHSYLWFQDKFSDGVCLLEIHSWTIKFIRTTTVTTTTPGSQISPLH